MRTEVLRVDPTTGPWDGLAALGRIIADGGLVAFPTETVYGIAVNLRDEAAVRRLYQAKGRPDEKPLTVHLPSPEALGRFVGQIPLAVRRLSDRFWPGPLTVVVSDRHGRPTGFRVPDLPVTQELLRVADCRVGATSANPSGTDPARTADEVLEQFDGILDAIVDGGPCRHGAASSVVRIPPEGDVEILRVGVVPEREIREATARLLLFVCSANRCRSPLAAAFATRLLSRRFGVDPEDLATVGYRVESAGTGCMHGTPATPEAESAGRDRGVDLSPHRARPLTLSLLESADEVYVMTQAQRDSILEFAPDAAPRVKPLSRRSHEIPDPYGCGPAAYAEAAGSILSAVQARLDDW